MDDDLVYKGSNHNIEKQTIFGLIKWPGRYSQLSQQLTPDMFDSDTCRQIMGCLHHVFKSSQLPEITARMVAEEIKGRYPDSYLILKDVLKSIGKDHRIDAEAELFYGVEKLKELRTARTLNEASYKMAKVLTEKFDVTKALGIFNEYHTKINIQQADVTRSEHKASLKELLEDMVNRRDNPDLFKGIAGICDWDELQGGELGCIALLRKSGKSACLSQMACENALQGHNIAYVTIESPERLMKLRFISHITKTPFEKLRKSELSNKELKKIYTYYNERKMSMGSMHIIDIPDRQTSNYIASVIKEINIKEKISVVYVDYMNIMRTNEGSASMYDWKIQAQISAELKAVARITNTPIWTGLQLNDAGDLSFAKNVGDNADLITTKRLSKGNEDSPFSRYIIMHARSMPPDLSEWIYHDFSTMTFDTGKRPTVEDEKLLNNIFNKGEE